MSQSLFSGGAPLAARMRPRSLEEVIGQDKALLPGSPLQILAKSDTANSSHTSILIWGPPGTGKTSIAKAVANSSGRRFIELSAVSTGVKELREVIDKARLDQELYGVSTIVFLDEIHRFSKAQQDALLPSVESGGILLIAATTENPSFSVIAPLLSRSLLVRLEPLNHQAIELLIHSAISDSRGLDSKVIVDSEALRRIVEISGGDARRALTVLEAAALRAIELSKSVPASIGIEDVGASLEAALVRYDRDGDQHYDTISAFIKSVRGSDADAAIHYLARMLEGGEDPRFIARRLILLASEDIGLADPTALSLAVAAHDSVSLVGMPEGRIPLAEVTIYLALAPKSNSAYLAINKAISDVKAGFLPVIPASLRSNYLSKGDLDEAYRYPHDDPQSVVGQVYVEGVPEYFEPKSTGFEKALTDRWPALKLIIRDKRA
ncbi:MAG: AAA family ATPase [Actinobacteria bacterium]|nr:AAA family ATPase [Actinomycetota bacterium]